MDFADVIPISALKADGVEIVLSAAEKFMTEERWFFPDDMITDQPERQIAAEIVREKILRTLDDEIPHGTAVVIEEFKETNSMIRIRAEIFCEKALKYDLILVPGDSFGAPGYFRMAYCIATEKVERSLVALRKFVESEYPDRAK